MTINSESFALRNATLADFEEHIGSALASENAWLEAALLEARDRHARERDEARATVAARVLELETYLARDAQEALRPLCAAFPDTPRTTAGEIADTWRALNARCLEELGAGLSYKHLAVALAAAHGLEAQIAGGGFFIFDGTNAAAQRSVETVDIIVGGAVPVVVEQALRELEIAIARRGPGYRPAPAARVLAASSRATENAIRAAVADVDAIGDPDEAARVHRENFNAGAAYDAKVQADQDAHRAEPRTFGGIFE